MKKEVKLIDVLAWYALIILAFLLLISNPINAQITIGAKGTGQAFYTTTTQTVAKPYAEDELRGTNGWTEKTTKKITEAYLMASPFIRYDYQIQDSPFFGSGILSLSDRSFKILKLEGSILFRPFALSFSNDHPDFFELGFSIDFDSGYSRNWGLCPFAAFNLPVDFDIDMMVGCKFYYDLLKSRHTRAELVFSFPLK